MLTLTLIKSRNFSLEEEERGNWSCVRRLLLLMIIFTTYLNHRGRPQGLYRGLHFNLCLSLFFHLFLSSRQSRCWGWGGSSLWTPRGLFQTVFQHAGTSHLSPCPLLFPTNPLLPPLVQHHSSSSSFLPNHRLNHFCLYVLVPTITPTFKARGKVMQRQDVFSSIYSTEGSCRYVTARSFNALL